MDNKNNIIDTNNEKGIIKHEIEEIKHKIYIIRGKQVILDSDIAKMYEVETKN